MFTLFAARIFVIVMKFKFLGRVFKISPEAKDGIYKTIIGLQILATMITFLSIPATAVFQYQFESIFYHTRFDSLALCFITGTVAGFGIGGDMLNVCYWIGS